MPNIKSAAKRVQMSKIQNDRNKASRSKLRTDIKRFSSAVEAGDQTAAAESYKVAVKAIDKAASDNILHKNNAARKKSSLTLKLNAMAK